MAKANRAAPKPASTVSETPNLPVSMAEEIKNELAATSERVSAPSGDLIKVSNDKTFTLPDGTKAEGPLNVVILDYAYGNTFYDQPYKEGVVVPPACFSRGAIARDLVPSDNSPDKQSDNCTKCPNNQFGSNGDGKACSNNAFIAVAEPGNEEPEIWVLKVSPTAIKGFDAYVTALKNKGLIPTQAITQVYFDPASKWPALRFGNPTMNPLLEKHFAFRKPARERLLREPEVAGYEPPKKAGRAAPAARR